MSPILLLIALVAGIECAEVNITVSEAPKLVHAVDTLNHPEGTNASLYCSIGSGDINGLTYEWFKDDKRIGPGSNPNKLRFSIHPENIHSMLRVVDLKVSDAGVYSCIARNTYGQDKISTKLNVKVQLKWVSEPKDIDIGVGKRIHIPCLAEGLPQPRIEWTKLGEEPETLGSDLRIGSVGQSDGGYYECRARNGIEKDLVARIKLNVLGKYVKQMPNVSKRSAI